MLLSWLYGAATIILLGIAAWVGYWAFYGLRVAWKSLVKEVLLFAKKDFNPYRYNYHDVIGAFVLIVLGIVIPLALGALGQVISGLLAASGGQ